MSQLIPCIVLAGALMWGCKGSKVQGGTESAVKTAPPVTPTSPTPATPTPATDSTCTPPDSAQLAISVKAQENDDWCWAASTQMVLASPVLLVHPLPKQCDVATKYFGPGSHCCHGAGVPDTCRHGGWPPFDQYGYTPQEKKKLTWNQVKTQIGCRGQAIAFGWQWVIGGTHMMVATGYKTEGTDRSVYIIDPLPVDTGQAYFISYEEYGKGTDHTHLKDYYNLVKKE